MTEYSKIGRGPKMADTPIINGLSFNAGYGNMPVPVGPGDGVAVGTATTRKTNTVAIPDSTIDSYTVTSQGSIGTVYPRDDFDGSGNPLVFVDFQAVETETPPASIVVQLEVTRSGVASSYALTINCAHGDQFGGVHDGRYYTFPKDSQGRPMVEPHEDSTLCYLSGSGLTLSDIAERHSVAVSALNGNFFRTTPARDANQVPQDVLYGEDPAYALAGDAAEIAWTAYNETGTRGHKWLVIADGDEFTDPSSLAASRSCYGGSPLHPMVYTRDYSGDLDDDRPVFQYTLPGVSVMQHCVAYLGLDVYRPGASGANGFDDGYTDWKTPWYIYVWDVKHQGRGINISVDTRKGYYMTFDQVSLPATYDIHPSGDLAKVNSSLAGNAYGVGPVSFTDDPVWGDYDNRTSSFHAGGGFNILLVDCFAHLGGVQFDYSWAANPDYPQTWNTLNHCGYWDHATRWIYYLRTHKMAGGLHAAQFRGGAVLQETTAVMNPLAWLLANGRKGVVSANYNNGSFSWMRDSVVTDGGKQSSLWLPGGSTNIAVNISGRDVVLNGNIIANSGPDGAAIDWDNDLAGLEGPPPAPYRFWGNRAKGDAFLTNGGIGTYKYNDSIVSGWGNTADQNTAGIPQADLDAINLRDWNAAEYGSPETDIVEIMADIAEERRPWEVMRAYWEYCRTRAGLSTGSARTTPTRCIWRPEPAGLTTGTITTDPADWSSGDLPGTVEGDGLDVAGKDPVFWQTPDNSLGHLYLLGGAPEFFSGKWDFSGDIVSSGTIRMRGNGQVWFSSPSIADGTYFDVRHGRLAFTGTPTGDFSVKVGGFGQFIVHEGSAVTIRSGETLTTLGGECQPGFDGTAGGAASLVLAAGSTWNVGPTATIHSDFPSVDLGKRQHYWPDETYEGATSGKTMDCVWVNIGDSSDAHIIVENLSGTLTTSENLEGRGMKGDIFTDPGTVIGDVNTVTYSWPKIRAYRSGWYRRGPGVANFDVATSVASSLTLAGALEIDARTITSSDIGAPIVIAEVDTLTGSFSGVSATGLDSGLDIEVEIDNSEGTVTLKVTGSGSGATTQNVL